MKPRPRHSPLRLAVIGLTLASPVLMQACAERPAPSAPRHREKYSHPVYFAPPGAPIPPPGPEPRLEAIR
jgi:hypothetical protein